MRLFQRFFRANSRISSGPDVSSLKEQLASDFRLFSSVRGRVALLRPGAAVVMNHLYQTFITKDVSTITDRRGIVAVVKIQELTSCEQVRFLRGEDLRGPAGTAVVHGLATQAATELLRQTLGEDHPALASARRTEPSTPPPPREQMAQASAQHHKKELKIGVLE